MVIYSNSAIGFRTAVEENTIVYEIEDRFEKILGRRVPPSEKRAWTSSLHYMETVVRKSSVPGDCGILIEYNIPSTSKRVDFIISGHDEQDNANFVIVELKQWDKAEATNKENLVVTYIGGRLNEVAHPSYQAGSYKKILSDLNEGVYVNNLNPYACAYLHNYKKSDPEPLLLERYQEVIDEAPLFFSPDVQKLENFIKRYVGKGRGKDILYQIEHGKIRPSKRFIDQVAEMYDNNEVFTLLDEQKVAYSNIISYAAAATHKTTILINGGPGTGKSVVAMSAFVELFKQGKNIKFVAPNASFKNAIVAMLSGKKYKGGSVNILFTGSASFYDALYNEFDVLVVDEAHRLKKKGAYMYKGLSQVDDIIKASIVNVFFIDDNQRIRPDDEGNVELIKQTAQKYGSEVIEVELKAQFRCAGAEGFINWVDHTLQIAETANFDGWDDDTYDFKIVDSPNILREEIKQKVNQGYKARLLAGYAWPWTAEKDGNTDAQIADVTMPEYDFAMPWNSRCNQYTWAIDNDKQDQIGCVHSSQGLEFDYIGVIIGNDLRYDPDTMEVYANYDDYFDSTGKKGLKNDKNELTKLIKNIYKILLTRGTRGCYVFCRDKALADYLKSRIKIN